MFTEEVIRYIQKSVLCWLATADADGFPNVSPKEMFTYEDKDLLLIANIASPNSRNNILQNNKVCISFVDILLQKAQRELMVLLRRSHKKSRLNLLFL